MGFTTKTRKQLNEIESKIDFLAKENLNKSILYDKTIEHLKNIKISVKSIKKFLDENGSIGIKIDYELPSVVLKFDDKNKIEKNKQFIAINLLNLISFDDMEKITQAIAKATDQNKN